MAVVEILVVFVALRPEVDFRAVGRTNAAFALKMDFTFSAPEPVA